MKDQDKTRDQLIDELEKARERLAEYGKAGIRGGRADDSRVRRSEFEILIGVLASDFISGAEDAQDVVARRALKRIAEFVKADRGYIFLFRSQCDEVENVCEWCMTDVAPRTSSMTHVVFEQEFGCIAPHIYDHNIFYVADVCAEGAVETEVQAYFQARGIRSMMVIPMVLAGKLVGFIGFESSHELRVRRDYDKIILKFCGEAFANALMRSRLEDSLRASEELYRNLYESVPVSIIVTDREGVIVGINPYHVQQIGKGNTTESDYLGKDVVTFPSIARANMSGMFRSVLEEGIPFECNDVLYPRTSGGEEAYFNVKGMPLLEQGAVVGAVYVHEDITERKRAEEYVRAIADYTCDWESWIAPDGTLKWVNPAVEQITGYTVEECHVMVDYPVSLIHEDERADFEELLDQALAEKNHTLDDFTIRITCKNGSIHWMAISWQSIYNAHGEYLGLRTSVRDFTERKRVADEHVRAIADYSYDLESWLAPDGCLKWVNPAVDKLTGYDVSECYEMTDFPLPIVHEDYREEFSLILNEALKTRSSLDDYDFRIACKNGDSRWAAVSWQAIYDSFGEYIGLRTSIRDITKRVESEELRRKQEDVMQRSEKMVTLGTLVAGVAHEINNPNNVIMLNAPFVKEAWDDAAVYLKDMVQRREVGELAGLSADEMLEEVPRLLDGIVRSGERIKRIVTQLKDYARERSSDPHYRTIQVNNVIRSAVDLVHNRIKNATRNLRLELSPQIPLIRGDYYQLEQVFINLLLNACDALDDMSQAVCVSTVYLSEDATVKVVIEDEGCGISEEVIKHMMDPFFTTKHDRGGTGLGLSISMRIIEEHEGTITYQSQPGEGTVATMTFKAESV